MRGLLIVALLAQIAPAPPLPPCPKGTYPAYDTRTHQVTCRDDALPTHAYDGFKRLVEPAVWIGTAVGWEPAVQLPPRCYDAKMKPLPCPKSDPIDLSTASVTAGAVAAADRTILVTTPGLQPPLRAGEFGSEASRALGEVIEVTALDGQPTGEWLRVEMVLKRTGRKPVTYELDSVRSATKMDSEHRPVWDRKPVPSDACAAERQNAIERVREAWAPRPPKSDGTWMLVDSDSDSCALECFKDECGSPCDLRKLSSRCLKCATAEREKRDEAAKEQADREAKARAALDAVDAACGK